MNLSKINISEQLVTKLIQLQFPKWGSLPVKMVKSCGMDNRTFHLGDKMLARLPSAEGYEPQVKKEQACLPKLATAVSTQIPVPIAMGAPSSLYPWHWSVYQWITGESLNLIKTDALDLEKLAVQLGKFLKELHQADTHNAPLAGAHNYYRGAHPSVYNVETCTTITALSNIIDADKALAVWHQALSSEWSKSPVWVHGDFAVGNILINRNQLAAVIDFGCMGAGDPACDLVIAWTFLEGKSREVFKAQVALDEDTWARARGWALWKAMITLVALEDKESPEAIKQQSIIDAVLNEHA